MAHISQREARRLRRRVEVLEDMLRRQRKTFLQEYSGVELWRFDSVTALDDVVRTARRCGHAVIVLGDDTTTLRFQALPHPSEKV